MALTRIQKLIAKAGFSSRRNVDGLIRQGRVKINEEVAKIVDKADLDKDKIFIDGKHIYKRIPKMVILIDKPRGVITTCHETHGRETVIMLLPQELRLRIDNILGHEVIDLKRTHIANLNINGLKGREWRILGSQELSYILKSNINNSKGI